MSIKTKIAKGIADLVEEAAMGLAARTEAKPAAKAAAKAAAEKNSALATFCE